MLAISSGRLEGLGYGLDVSPEARELVAALGWDEKYGARPLRRAIQTNIEDPAAELILSGALSPGDTILAGASDGKIVLTRGGVA
jgi:ATP-dependent Clp protease ATP-binding subunit ClpC